MKKVVLIALLFMSVVAVAQSIQIALVRYSGGGDWYANPTSLPNLVSFCNLEIGMDLNPNVATVEVGSRDIFNYPFVHITGHGNINLSPADVANLRTYLLAGGFLHIDDNYGLKDIAMREMRKVFPETDFVELPYGHEIFKKPYPFPEGLPKIHEHDNKPPQAFGLIIGGRLVCLLTYECDLGDGWEDIRVHNDSEESHLKALKMGANILQYVFSQ